MDYVRQRLLQAVVPVVTFVVTVPLAAAGRGRLEPRHRPAGRQPGRRRGRARRLAVPPAPCATTAPSRGATWRFSVPRLRRGASRRSSIAQGQILAFDVDRGLAGAGFVTLAADAHALHRPRRPDRHLDDLPGDLRHPATAPGRSTELFVKSNRATLLWTLPFAAGSCSSPPTSSPSCSGDEWGPARRTAPGPRGRRPRCSRSASTGSPSTARTSARGRRPSRPSWRRSAFCALAIPGLARRRGRPGSSSAAVPRSPSSSGVRARYVQRAAARRAAPATCSPGLAVPTAVAATAVLALRAALWGSGRPRPRRSPRSRSSLAVVLVLSLRLERSLVAELMSAVRRAGPAEQQPGEGDGDEGERGHLPVPVDAGVQGPR